MKQNRHYWRWHITKTEAKKTLEILSVRVTDSFGTVRTSVDIQYRLKACVDQLNPMEQKNFRR